MNIKDTAKKITLLFPLVAVSAPVSADLAILVVSYNYKLISQSIPIKNRDECIALVSGAAANTYNRVATVTCLFDDKPPENFQCGGTHMVKELVGCKQTTPNILKLENKS